MQLRSHLPRRRMEQRQQLGRAVAEVLMRVASRTDRRLPAGAETYPLRTSPPPEFAAVEIALPAEKAVLASTTPPRKTSHRGFFGKVRGFFAALFGGRAKS